MPASRALPEPGEPPTTGAWSPRRTPSRRGRSEAKRGEARRSGLQKTAGMAIPPDRERGIPWSAEPPSQMPGGLPQAHGRAWGGSCARRAWPSLLRMRLLQPWFNLSGEGVGDAVCGPRAFSEFTGVPLGLGDQVPDAATPLKIRRGARSRMPRSPRRRAPLETRRAGDIQRPGSPREGEGVPKRPSRRRLGRKTDCGKRSDRYEHH